MCLVSGELKIINNERNTNADITNDLGHALFLGELVLPELGTGSLSARLSWQELTSPTQDPRKVCSTSKQLGFGSLSWLWRYCNSLVLILKHIATSFWNKKYANAISFFVAIYMPRYVKFFYGSTIRGTVINPPCSPQLKIHLNFTKIVSITHNVLMMSTSNILLLHLLSTTEKKTKMASLVCKAVIWVYLQHVLP